MAAKPYNGHESWNAWNVSLWIGNDEGLYNLARDCIAANRNKTLAARAFVLNVGATRTPDGANYSCRSVELAMRDL